MLIIKGICLLFSHLPTSHTTVRADVYKRQVQDIVDAVKNGKLDIKDVDRNVRRMLEYIVKTPRFKGYKYSGEPDLSLIHISWYGQFPESLQQSAWHLHPRPGSAHPVQRRFR